MSPGKRGGRGRGQSARTRGVQPQDRGGRNGRRTNSRGAAAAAPPNQAIFNNAFSGGTPLQLTGLLPHPQITSLLQLSTVGTTPTFDYPLSLYSLGGPQFPLSSFMLGGGSYYNLRPDLGVQLAPLDMRVHPGGSRDEPSPPVGNVAVENERHEAVAPRQEDNAQLARAMAQAAPRVEIEQNPEVGQGAVQNISGYDVVSPDDSPNGPLLGGLSTQQIPLFGAFHKKFQYKSWTEGASSSNTVEGNPHGGGSSSQVGQGEGVIRCWDVDGTLKDIRTSPFISEDLVRDRVRIIGAEETQREIDAFASLVVSGNQYREEIERRAEYQARLVAEARALEAYALERASRYRSDALAIAQQNLPRVSGGQDNPPQAACQNRRCSNENCRICSPEQ